MNTTMMTFSPTGGTRKAAELFAGELDAAYRHIDLTERDADFAALRFGPEDLCVAAVPAYGGRAPQAAVERIRRMTGGGAKAIAMAVYGNRAQEDTLIELRDALADAGFVCIAGIVAVAEHSIVRAVAAGRPDEADAAALAGYARQVRAKLDGGLNGGTDAEPALPGSRPYRKLAVIPMQPKAGRRCTGCGLCVKVCPVGAIPADKPGKVDEKACISCMRCVTVCPAHARAVNGLMRAAVEQKLKKNCAARRENELYV